MKKYKVASIVGSLRKESLNRKLAENMARLAPDSIEMDIVEIGQLQMYNQDLDDENPPKEWVKFRKKVAEYDAVFFFTPEYNRLPSGAISNAIDVGSRPRSENVWKGKPAAVASLTIGRLGACLANHALRQSLVCLGMPTMATPEMYFSNGAELFDEQGQVVENSEAFVQKCIQEFADWVEQILK